LSGGIWVPWYAYATSQPGSLIATNFGGNFGSCVPIVDYDCYVYYCTANVIDPVLTSTAIPPCGSWTGYNPTVCRPVEAFIDVRPYITAGGGPPFPDIYLRVFYYSDLVAARETQDFIWAATTEYLDWYYNNLYLPLDNSYMGFNPDMSAYFGPPSSGPILIPLLKTTNPSNTTF
jgi:hypothetical protein